MSNQAKTEKQLTKRRQEALDSWFPWEYTLWTIGSLPIYLIASLIGAILSTVASMIISGLIIEVFKPKTFGTDTLHTIITALFLLICMCFIAYKLGDHIYSEYGTRSRYPLFITFAALSAIALIAQILLYKSDWAINLYRLINEDVEELGIYTSLKVWQYIFPCIYYMTLICIFIFDNESSCKYCNLTNILTYTSEDKGSEVIRVVEKENGGIYTKSFKVNDEKVTIEYHTDPEYHESYERVVHGITTTHCPICNSIPRITKYEKRGYAATESEYKEQERKKRF